MTPSFIALFRFLLSALLAIFLLGCSPAPTPNLTLSDIRDESKTINISQPQKPLLLVLWATTCPTCIEEIPSLIKLNEQYGDKITIVAVAMDYDNPEQLKNFIQQKNLPYMVTHDVGRQVAQGMGNIYVVPTNFLIAPNGEQVWKIVGVPDYSKLVKKIDQLLTPSS